MFKISVTFQRCMQWDPQVLESDTNLIHSGQNIDWFTDTKRPETQEKSWITEVFLWLRKTTSQHLSNSTTRGGRHAIVKVYNECKHRVFTASYNQHVGKKTVWRRKEAPNDMKHNASEAALWDGLIRPSVEPGHFCLLMMWLLIEVSGWTLKCLNLYYDQTKKQKLKVAAVKAWQSIARKETVFGDGHGF